MEKSNKKSFAIVALALSVVGAALTLVTAAAIFGGAMGFLLMMPLTYLACEVFFTVMTTLLAIVGGVYAYRHKKYASELSLFALIFQILNSVLYIALYEVILRLDGVFILGTVFQVVSTAVLAVALGFVEKPERFFITMAGPVFGMFGGIVLIVVSSINVVAEAENSTLLFAGFIITALVITALAFTGGSFSHYGKESFGLTIGALLFQGVQFVLICVMLTGIHFVLLGIGGLLFVIIGGILVADGHENGFMIIAFGIIFFLVWLFLLALENLGIMIGAFLVIMALVMFVEESITTRKRSAEIENGKLAGK